MIEIRYPKKIKKIFKDSHRWVSDYDDLDLFVKNGRSFFVRTKFHSSNAIPKNTSKHGI
jgi:transcription elongation factor GreA-like protein